MCVCVCVCACVCVWATLTTIIIIAVLHTFPLTLPLSASLLCAPRAMRVFFALGVLLAAAAVAAEAKKAKGSKGSKKKEAEDRLRKKCDSCHSVVEKFQKGEGWPPTAGY